MCDQNIVRVHGLTGGGAATLNDAFIKKENLEYICYHHEQSAGHAAIGEAKFKGNVAVVNPTTGCGGTNCATSVLNAWQDSTPVLFISGNVKKETCTNWFYSQKGIKLRKYGIQEHDIVSTYKDITKYSVFLDNKEDVKNVMEKSWLELNSGRKGPVWIDIPADIQATEIDTYKPYFKSQLSKKEERPLLLVGYGIRQSGNITKFKNFIQKYQIPYVSTYGARDYTAFEDRLNIGTVGIRGSRAGNFALQNSDLLLILGSSLGSSVVGYEPDLFSPQSYKILVDCDIEERYH